MGKVLTIGEPMAMFIAQTTDQLKNVKLFERHIAGAEVNVSTGLARLGHQVTYVTELGKDPFGEHIIDFLNKESIETSLIKINSKFPTGFQLKSKDTSKDPEVIYFRKGSAASNMGINRLSDIDFLDIDIFHVTGILMALNNETYQLIDALIKKAKSQNTLITFDPNLRPSLWDNKELMIERINSIAKQVDYILPGIKEGEILTNYKDVDKIADFYLGLGVKGVIVKLGPEGAYAKWNDLTKPKSLVVSGFEVEAVDTVGAGDGFAVGIISGLLEEKTLGESMVRANAIGAIQVSHISDNENLPNQKQLEDFIQTH